MDTASVRRLLFTAAVFGGAALWLLAVYLLSLAIADWQRFADLLPWIVLINIAGLTTLLLLIVSRLTQLVHNWRERVTGSRLEVRMVWLSGLLAVTPLLIVFYFSVQFINRSIDSWFAVEIGNGLRSAVSLSRASLQLRSREYLYRSEKMAEKMSAAPQSAGTLEELRREYGADQASVLDSHDRIVAFASPSTAAFVPSLLSPEALLQAKQGEPFVSLEPVRPGEYHVRISLRLPGVLDNGEYHILQVLYPIEAGLSALTEVVETSTKQYTELVRAREPLKTVFILTLTLVLVMSVFGAIYGAMWVARRLVKPIENLVIGTRAVARGDFDTRLPLTSHDEMGVLIHSFNDMTKRLADARRQTTQSQQAVEAERTKLAVVLARLSTGVIALEANLTVRTANEAAGQILGVDLHNSVGQPFATLADTGGASLAAQFVEAFIRHLQAGEHEWREQLSLRTDSGRRSLVCACTALPSDENQPGGYVIVFDDITALLQAQRDAAWGEVARRLAHEIKNPLTPIRLSAERLQHKLRGSLDESEADVLERATSTIVQHVDAMKNMVNAFSQYARAPAMEISAFSINDLVGEVVELYRAEDPRLSIRAQLDPQLPDIQADSGKVRQILHNLLKNSLEALEGRGEISIRTSLLQRGAAKVVEIVVEDNGPGFQPEFFGRMFDPYVTSKTKGTGLGLAIVKKIVEEHGGYIEAENRPQGGALVRLELPVIVTARAPSPPLESRHGETWREKT